jgi:hypothetical protein
MRSSQQRCLNCGAAVTRTRPDPHIAGFQRQGTQRNVPNMEANPARRFDPLAAVRTQAAGEFDLLLAGTVFQDIIFTGLPHAPEPGTEIWSEGMGSCPGGVANQAIAAARLGLRTGLAAAFGDDGYGDYNWKVLDRQEHVDLSLSRRIPGWHSPVTVSLSVDHDRSMVTHGHPAPVTSSELIGNPPRCAGCCGGPRP